MCIDPQTKLTAFLGGIVLFLVSNLGSYLYGHSEGVDSEQGKQAKVEVARVDKVAGKAIADGQQLAADVAADNEKERKANEELDQAKLELAKYRDADRRRIAEHGGLQFNVIEPVCLGSGVQPGQAETAGAGDSNGVVTRTIVLPQEIDQDLQDSADEADAILERLRTLRDWALSQGF